jgi:hypothetical protein
LVAVVGLVAVALAGGLGVKIGQGRAKGAFAIAVTSADANHPRAMFMRVKSSPRQAAIAQYQVVCVKGFSGAPTHGTFNGRTPLVRRLRLPFSEPRTCSSIAVAQLRGGGFLTVQIFAKR